MLAMTERNFQLNIDPRDKLTFSGDLENEIQNYVRLTNKSDSRQAFKVKCSRNDLFKIKPSSGVLDYGKSAEVCITFKPNKDYEPVSGRHHLLVCHIPAPDGSSSVGPPLGELRMKIMFENKD
ncbi:Major sperm protein [Aphelenchoides bicaudatus]|nr:Major sperm protein [Aphelenchoides bicaudatus]